DAMVNFSNSTLYDLFDFKGKSEVRIPKCDYGCVIFAATLGSDSFNQYNDKVDPFARNLYIHDNTNQSNIMSFVDLALQTDSFNIKIPLVIEGPADISVRNMNAATNEGFNIVFYVIEKSIEETIDYEVYDLAHVTGIEINPQSEIVTFMSARKYKLFSNATAHSTLNKVVARLAGFDNAHETNKDDCEMAFQTEGKRFFGFSIQPNTPLVSLLIDKPRLLTLETNFEFTQARDLAENGFITSPGWNGCHNANSGGIQTFRSPNYLPTDSYFLSGDEQYEVQFAVIQNFNPPHQLVIADEDYPPIFVTGYVPIVSSFLSTNSIGISYADMTGDQGFIFRHEASPIPTTTAKPVTKTTPKAPVTDNYCNCGLVDGWLDDWDASEIWVDLVVILDTSASMGGELEEAKSLLTSFISLMSTDTAAEFYSRIGVIAVSDTIEVVYNLNMSSTDSLDSVKQHKVDKIDVGAAFQAALTMFADGSKRQSYRDNAKQIVYYLTNSAPGANMNGVEDFKTSGGIIIVNDFVIEGGVADAGLMKLASDNFFFTDLSENYLSNVVVLCEANCFCNPSKHAFNDDENSPRTEANRGCFHPVNNGIPQSKARETCQKEGAALVSIHDQDKEFFVSSVISIFGPKKKYWIGLQNDGNSWKWDDKSTDPFSDWDVNQPNTNGGKLLCAYATQTTGLNVGW
ncbi:hypothetical protein PENTCL1PPCAC_2965, partial [Pristionchus entomophagus]